MFELPVVGFLRGETGQVIAGDSRQVAANVAEAALEIHVSFAFFSTVQPTPPP